MASKDEQKFLDELLATSAKKVKIMSLEEINTTLGGIMPEFRKRGMEANEYTVLNVSAIQDFEGIIRIAVLEIIPPGKKTLDRVRKHLVWGESLDAVCVPIIIRNGNIDYIELVSQSRFVLAGKVSLEVNRGYVIGKGIPFEEYPYNLINRKVPYLKAITDFVDLVFLGNFWENTGVAGQKIAVWAFFCKTKVEMDPQDLKIELKDRHERQSDPKSGPPLHNTEPALKTFEEIKQRLDDIILNPKKTITEAYLNDLFSITALSTLFRYLELNGSPFDK